MYNVKSLKVKSLKVQSLKPLSLVMAIATFLPIVMTMPDGAIAVPANQTRGCLGDTFVNADGTVQDDYQSAFILDGSHSSINVRARPNTNSPIQYVATSRIGVTASRWVVGEDNYCWFQVAGDIWNGNRVTGSFTGWVRGDLVGIEI